MEYRDIPSPIYTEKYVVANTYHSNGKKTFQIDLEHGYHHGETARISFKDVLAIRFTPLKLCLSEYCEAFYIDSKKNNRSMENYSGVTELINCDELKDKTTFAKAYGYKHYLILTEDEYVEVLAKEDPFIEAFNVDE